jgi:hypothetical protein
MDGPVQSQTIGQPLDDQRAANARIFELYSPQTPAQGRFSPFACGLLSSSCALNNASFLRESSFALN